MIELKDDSCEKEPVKNSIFSKIPMLKPQNNEELEFVMEDEPATNLTNHPMKEEKPVKNFIKVSFLLFIVLKIICIVLSTTVSVTCVWP